MTVHQKEMEKFAQAIYKAERRIGAAGTAPPPGGGMTPNVVFSSNGLESGVRTWPTTPTASRFQIPGDSTATYWFRLAQRPIFTATTVRLTTTGPIRVREHGTGSFGTTLNITIHRDDWQNLIRIEIESTGSVTADTSAQINHQLTSPSSVQVDTIPANVFNSSPQPVGGAVGRIIVSTESGNAGDDITSAVPIDEGSSDSLYVRLGVAPDAADTSITLRVSAEATGLTSDISHISVTSGGNSLITSSGSSHATRRLTFNSTNYQTAQRIDVAALQDGDIEDGGFRITLIAEVDHISSNYNLVTKNILISHVDQTTDQPAAPDNNLVYLRENLSDTPMGLITVSQAENSVTSHYVSLSHRPRSTVTVRPQFQQLVRGRWVAVNVGDDIRLRSGSSNLSSLVNTLTFTTSSYNTPQRVYIHTSEDASSVNASYRVVYYAQNGGYNNRNARIDLTVTETVLVPARIELSTSTLSLNEGGSDRAYTVDLSVIPQGTVEVDISVPSGLPVNIATGTTAPSDGYAKSLTLSFNNDTYNVPQNVFVRPDTTDSDTVTNTGNITHSISTSRRTTFYETTPSETVAVTVTDAGVITTPEIVFTSDSSASNSISSLTFDEGTDATYYVSLQTPPDNDVQIMVGSSDTSFTSRVSVSPSSFTIRRGNWDNGHRVTLTALLDNNSPYSANVPHTSNEVGTTSGDYDGISENLRITINDVPTVDGNITLSPTSITLSENGRNNFDMRLTSQPSGTVSVLMVPTSGSDIRLSGTGVSNNTVTFSTSNYDVNQTVEVLALSDTDSFNDVGIIAMRASGGGYNAAKNLSFTVIDDDSDTPRRVITSVSSLFIEEGTSDSYTVRLSHPPTDITALTVSVSYSAPSGITISPSTLDFTIGNYSMPQTVTVTVGSDVTGGNFDITNRVSPTYRTRDGRATYYNSALVSTTHTEAAAPAPPVMPPATDTSTHSHGTQVVSFTHRHLAPDEVVETEGAISTGETDDTLPDGLKITYMVLPLPTSS